MPACFFGIRMINPIYFQIFYIFTFMRTSLFLGMTGFAFLTTFGLQGCSDDEGGNDGKNPPPTINVEVGDVTRTTASFTITTSGAADYAYAVLPASETIADAEALFENGIVAMFEGAKKVEVKIEDLTGDTEYKLYAAARNLNPFLYSKLVSESIDTHVAYTDMITLESVKTTSFAYHIMKPEGVAKYKHVCLSKSDYDYIINLAGGTPASYVSAFGKEATEDDTYVFDTTFFDAGGFRQDIYSDMEFIIIAGEVDGEGQVAKDAAKMLVFKTKKAGTAPYGIDVSVSNIASMTADITIKPEEGIERFRYHVNTKAEFDYIAFEGEASVRRMIIGHWDDVSNESSGTITVNAKGLKPNTEYQVGIVGFDKDMREKFLLYDFTTGEPTGPLPELTAEPVTVETPWNKAAFKIKTTYTVSMVAGVFPRGSIEDVLSRPGNEALTAGDVIAANGTSLTPEQVAAAMSGEGLVIESDVLTPNTEYEFGVCATNEESVGVSVVKDFATVSLPQYDGNGVRAKLPGKYTATTKDLEGKTVTFSVTIATGVNEATEKAYHDMNRLVVLGFAPCGVEYADPEKLLANGWVANEEEANAGYGPKWFIEFNSDNTISTSAPINGELDYTMAKFNGKELYFHGYAKRPNSDNYTDMAISFPIEVADDLTLTVKKAVDNSFEYYPGVLSGTSQWWGDMAFAASDEIVLTRDADQGAEPAAVKNVRQVSLPERVTVNLDAAPVADSRRIAAERMMR